MIKMMYSPMMQLVARNRFPRRPSSSTQITLIVRMEKSCPNMRLLLTQVTGNGKITCASSQARSWSNHLLVWPSATRRGQLAATTSKMRMLEVCTPVSYQGLALVTSRSYRSFPAWVATKTPTNMC